MSIQRVHQQRHLAARRLHSYISHDRSSMKQGGGGGVRTMRRSLHTCFVALGAAVEANRTAAGDLKALAKTLALNIRGNDIVKRWEKGVGGE